MNGTTLNNNKVLRKSKSCVIGISGVTNGGKTSLCRRLQPAFPNCTVLNMDDYYWPDDSTNHVRAPGFLFNNYEVPSSVDFKRLTEDILTWIGEHQYGENKHVLLVEGILIFNYKPLVPCFDRKYFLTLGHEECSQRRRFRGYDPPDPPGYFDRICWPWYLKNKEELAEQKDIVFLEGNQSQEKTFQKVLKEIKTHMHY